MSRKKPQSILKKKQFETYSFDDIMTHSYGIKGTFTEKIKNDI